MCNISSLYGAEMQPKTSYLSPHSFLLKFGIFFLFLFLFFFQEELDQIKAVWNSHRIRPSMNHNVPSGIPNLMYSVPQLCSSEDFIVPHNDLDICKEACTFLSNVPCDKDIFDICNIIASEMGLTFPKSILEVQQFHVKIREALRSLIFN